MSVPAVAGHGGWQSRRVRRLSASASAYAAVVALAALAAAAVAVAGDTSTEHEWLAFAILLPLAAIAPLFRVPVGRNHSLHAAPAFVVAGALVLPPLLVVALVARAARSAGDPRPLPVVHPDVQHRELHAQRPRGVARRRGDRPERRSRLRAGRPGCGRRLRRRQPCSARSHAAARPRAHLPRERPLLRIRPRNRIRDRRSRRRGRRRSPTFNPWLLPALIAPLALAHRSLSTVALLRETRRAVQDDVRVRADGDDARRRRRRGHGREPLRSGAARLRPRTRAPRRTPTRSGTRTTREDGARLYAELIRGDRDSYRREARFLTKDGRTVVTHLAVALVRDADGKPRLHDRDGRGRHRAASSSRSSCARARSSRRSAGSPAASRTTSTTC